MRIHPKANRSGIALIIVLLVMVVLGILAGGFAYSMKVELTLARKAAFDPEMEWIGRSGVEYAAYILGNRSVDVPDMFNPGIKSNVDSLDKKWAGGASDTNSILASVPMENVPLGNGRFSLKIIDLDRKFNINRALLLPNILEEAIGKVVGIDGGNVGSIAACIRDWCDDTGNDTHMGGAESDDYLSGPNPGFPSYRAKDGPIDDITELLLVRGITPAMFWGSAGDGYSSALPQSSPVSQSHFEDYIYEVGLVDLFTPLSGGQLNINTASAEAFRVFPEIDNNTAQQIVQDRSGPLGPFIAADGSPHQQFMQLFSFINGKYGNVLTVQSQVFEVHVKVELSGNHREYTAILHAPYPPPNGRGKVQVLTFYWR